MPSLPCQLVGQRERRPLRAQARTRASELGRIGRQTHASWGGDPLRWLVRFQGTYPERMASDERRHSVADQVAGLVAARGVTVDEHGVPINEDGTVDKRTLSEMAWYRLGHDLVNGGPQAAARAAGQVLDRVEGRAAQKIDVEHDQKVTLVFASPALMAIPEADRAALPQGDLDVADAEYLE